MSNLKKGRSYYFLDKRTNQLVKGRIIEISRYKGEPYATVRELQEKELWGVKLRELYETEQQYYAAQYKKNKSIKAFYKHNINSVEDLVRFVYNHVMMKSSNCTDYVALEVYEEKTKELLGINLGGEKK